MRFNLLSDLHLEFSSMILPGDPESILLLSGDIMMPVVFEKFKTDHQSTVLRERFKQFFFEECSKYKKALYISGNHEHYNGTFQNTIGLMKECAEGTNVSVLDNETVDLGNDTVLFGGTMWTNFNNNNPVDMQHAQYNMNDYHLTDWVGGFPKSRRMLPSDTYDIFVSTRGKILDFLEANPDKKVVMMTHHAPSFKSKHPRYEDSDRLNHAYYSALDMLIMNNPQIKVWVHGHTHESHDYQIGETRIICNPRGYSMNGNNDQENRKFDINKSFEVD